jgi:tRNA pseudouridine65 synthase
LTVLEDPALSPDGRPGMIDILHQDDHLLVINKPAGWLVHRTELDRHESRVILPVLRIQTGRMLWPLHRLDKGTSGVLAFALDADTASRMSACFDSGEGVTKHYRAIVRGWPPDSMLIDHPLRRLADDSRPGRDTAQAARTTLMTRCRGSLPIPQGPFPSLRWAEVELEPQTGRRHQLRRHMKHIAHPIIGDATHGKGAINRAVAEYLGVARLWLHAESLALRHPWSGERLCFAAPRESSWARWGEGGC